MPRISCLGLALLVVSASLLPGEDSPAAPHLLLAPEGADGLVGCAPCPASDGALRTVRTHAGRRRVLIEVGLPPPLDLARESPTLVLARGRRVLLCADLRPGARRMAPGRMLLRRGNGGTWRLGITFPRDAIGVGAWQLALRTRGGCLHGLAVIPPRAGRLAP